MNVIAHQGDTLDTLCQRHYGRTEGVVEAVLLANPGLAELGVVLPHGEVGNQREPLRRGVKQTKIRHQCRQRQHDGHTATFNE